MAKEYAASRTQCTLPSSSWTKGREEGRGAGRENDFRFSARKIVGQSRGTNRDRHLSANWGHRGILIDPFSGSEIETDDRSSVIDGGDLGLERTFEFYSETEIGNFFFFNLKKSKSRIFENF